MLAMLLYIIFVYLFNENYGDNVLVKLQQKRMEFELLSARITKDGSTPFAFSKKYIKDIKIGIIGLTILGTVAKSDSRIAE